MEKHGNEQMEQESKEVKTVLTLDEEKKYDMSFMEPSLKAQAGSLVDDGKTAAAGAVDESMLTDEERKQVAEFVKQIDVSDIRWLILMVQVHKREFLLFRRPLPVR